MSSFPTPHPAADLPTTHRQNTVMRHRTPVFVFLVPLRLFGAPKPASAQFDLGSSFQRAQIIAKPDHADRDTMSARSGRWPGRSPSLRANSTTWSARRAVDQVGEADILALFRDQPPGAATRALEGYHRAREAADRQCGLDYATLDAAAQLAATIESAQGWIDDLTAPATSQEST